VTKVGRNGQIERHRRQAARSETADQFMKILVGGILILSLALDVFLWTRLRDQAAQLKQGQASAGEADELRRQNEELQAQRTSAPDSSAAEVRELARLRNEVSQLRKQAADMATLRTQAAEAAQLRAQLVTATYNLARAESNLADTAKLSPEQMQQLKEEAQSVQCVNHMKQIGLAARIWSNDHKDIFPPDFLTMKEELSTPKILFCPADTSVVRVTEWSELNPSTISYRFLNPNGSELEPSKVLTTCPIHGHVGLSDGSVQRR